MSNKFRFTFSTIWQAHICCVAVLAPLFVVHFILGKTIFAKFILVWNFPMARTRKEWVQNEWQPVIDCTSHRNENFMLITNLSFSLQFISITFSVLIASSNCSTLIYTYFANCCCGFCLLYFFLRIDF